MMIYKDSKGNKIENIVEWEKYIFDSPKKRTHWKEGRSAMSIAKFMMNQNGVEFISNIISNILTENSEIILNEAIPELEIRFDNYGHGREHDLGIYGKTDSGKTIFIGVEAKVDESFGKKVTESYFVSKSKELNGVSTNSGKRIEGLLKRNFKKIIPEVFDLRYQLLYSTVGTLDANHIETNSKADISLLLIIVFKTDKYDSLKGCDNYKDYVQFIELMDSEKIPCENGINAHKLDVNGEVLYSAYTEIYSVK